MNNLYSARTALCYDYSQEAANNPTLSRISFPTYLTKHVHNKFHSETSYQQSLDIQDDAEKPTSEDSGHQGSCRTWPYW